MDTEKETAWKKYIEKNFELSVDDIMKEKQLQEPARKVLQKIWDGVHAQTKIADKIEPIPHHVYRQTTDAEIESLLEGTAKKLYDIWMSYYRLSVYKNEHMARNLFFMILGAFLTQKKGLKLLYSARYNTFRVHLMFIQPSGSAKSEAMKAAHFFMRSLGLNGLYLTQTSDAGLVGSVRIQKQGKIEPIPGALETEDYLFWDEGTTLLSSSKNAHSENKQTIIQQATDEPGTIVKKLKDGTPAFDSHTSICAGSYWDSSIDATLLGKGLFQRQLVSYCDVTWDDAADYIRNSTKLAIASNNDKRKLAEEFRTLVWSLDEKQFNGSTGTYHVNFDEGALDRLNEKIIGMLEYLRDDFDRYDLRGDLLRTFFTRFKQIYHVAAIVAAVNGKKTVGDRELEVGFIVWRSHLKSIHAILEKHRTWSRERIPDEFSTVTAILNARGPLNQSELVKAMMDHPQIRKGRDSCTRIIKELIAKDKLIESTGDRNERVIKIAS